MCIGDITCEEILHLGGKRHIIDLNIKFVVDDRTQQIEMRTANR